MPPDLISNPVNQLRAILEKLTGSTITEIVVSPDGSSVRLDFYINSGAPKFWYSPVLRIVVTGKPHVFYQSYTEIAAYRNQLTEPEKIVSKNLILQGVAIADMQTLVLYCHAPVQVEAGELLVTGTAFQLYDEQYGRIEVNTFLAMLHKKA